jgi:transcription elongation factor Elf1
MKMRNKAVERQMVCLVCKANLEKVVMPAWGARKDTHEMVTMKCMVCGYSKDSMVPKVRAKVNSDGTGSFVGKLVGMGF